MIHKFNAKALIAATLSLLFSNLYAQELPCGTTISEDDLSAMRQESSNEQTTISISSEIQYFAVTHHIVRRTDGTGGVSGITPELAIEYLNSAFQETNIRFYTCGPVDEIHNNAYFDFVSANSESAMMARNNTSAINVFYFNTVFSDGSYVAGYSYYPETNKNFIAISHSGYHASTIPHEFGHFFGLSHTHEIVRHPKDFVDGSKCQIHGDTFCDTPADPGLSSANVNSANCTYFGTATDGHGDFYAPNERNLMSYSPGDCRTEFSGEQVAKMNEWSNDSKRQIFVHTTNLSNQTITSDKTYSGGLIIIDGMTIQNNADVVFDNCGPVIIEKDFEITIGATLEMD